MAYSKDIRSLARSGSSGGEVNDLNPQRSYDVDIRRLNERRINDSWSCGHSQRRAAKSCREVSASKAFHKEVFSEAKYDGPWTDRQGQVPAFTEGDQFSRAGATAYAAKPQPSTSKLYY